MKTKIMPVLALLLALTLLLAACGKETAPVTVQDRGVVTRLSVALPASVEDILHEAEIVLGPGDRVIPALDAVLDVPGEITVCREAVVRLTVDDRTTTVTMVGGRVRDLLEQQGVQPKPGQRLNCDENAWLTDGMEIRLSGRCTVEILYHGKSIVADVEAESVGEALTAAGILLDPNDRVSPAPDEPLRDGMQIRVSLLRYEDIQELQPVRYDTRYERDDSLPPGAEELSVEGVDGEKLVRFRVTYADGREEGRELIGEEITRRPVEAVVRVGPKDTSGLTIVSKKAYYDCDGSGHGYYEIEYSDGSKEYIRF